MRPLELSKKQAGLELRGEHIHSDLLELMMTFLQKDVRIFLDPGWSDMDFDSNKCYATKILNYSASKSILETCKDTICTSNDEQMILASLLTLVANDVHSTAL